MGLEVIGDVERFKRDQEWCAWWHCHSCGRDGRIYYWKLEQLKVGFDKHDLLMRERIGRQHNHRTSGLCLGRRIQVMKIAATGREVEKTVDAVDAEDIDLRGL